MYEQLYKSLHLHVELTDSEWEKCKHSFIPKKMRKRMFMLQEGDICTRLAFIEKGALYSYSTDEKGTQHVMQFGFEGWWIADLYSFLTGDVSRLAIEVLEDCEILLIDKENHQDLEDTIPAFNKYNRILYQNALISLQQRIDNTLGLTAEEKYIRFLNTYPTCMDRVPQHLIASYLGISPETLSRVRGHLASGS